MAKSRRNSHSCMYDRYHDDPNASGSDEYQQERLSSRNLTEEETRAERPDKSTPAAVVQFFAYSPWILWVLYCGVAAYFMVLGFTPHFPSVICLHLHNWFLISGVMHFFALTITFLIYLIGCNEDENGYDVTTGTGWDRLLYYSFTFFWALYGCSLVASSSARMAAKAAKCTEEVHVLQFYLLCYTVVFISAMYV
eukprot:g357.t1